MSRIMTEANCRKMQLIAFLRYGETVQLPATAIAINGKAKSAANQLRIWISRYWPERRYLIEVIGPDQIRVTRFSPDPEGVKAHQAAGDALRAQARYNARHELSQSDASQTDKNRQLDSADDLIGQI